ncbi:hypothetical protein GW17_00002987 [Ensete ventricosum]|nr:hypothetical protein GW17_00002987 [Ensete ventricosum]
MAKGGSGKLSKLKCMIKRWNSSSRITSGGGEGGGGGGASPRSREKAEEGWNKSASFHGDEVVLFEHLLWMLENAEPPPESLDEFYAC